MGHIWISVAKMTNNTEAHVNKIITKIVSEYYQEIPQSKTADKPTASRRRATQQSRDTRKTKKAKQPAPSSPSR